jgi:LemA protein
MNGFFIFWTVLAVILFWSFGAYNRLVRLRSQAIAAFPAIENQFRQYVTLVQANFPGGLLPLAGEAQAHLRAELISAWAGLVGATEQFEVSLRVARARPLNAETMGALVLAQQTLFTSWLRLRNEPPDLAGALLPENLQMQWERIAQQADRARLEFNQHVTAYNDAIEQFPARLLAWLFGFKPAQLI